MIDFSAIPRKVIVTKITPVKDKEPSVRGQSKWNLVCHFQDGNVAIIPVQTAEDREPQLRQIAMSALKDLGVPVDYAGEEPIPGWG